MIQMTSCTWIRLTCEHGLHRVCIAGLNVCKFKGRSYPQHHIWLGTGADEVKYLYSRSSSTMHQSAGPCLCQKRKFILNFVFKRRTQDSFSLTIRDGSGAIITEHLPGLLVVHILHQWSVRRDDVLSLLSASWWRHAPAPLLTSVETWASAESDRSQESPGRIRSWRLRWWQGNKVRHTRFSVPEHIDVQILLRWQQMWCILHATKQDNELWEKRKLSCYRLQDPHDEKRVLGMYFRKAKTLMHLTQIWRRFSLK